MRKTTVTIPAVEMTQEEEKELWYSLFHTEKKHWETRHGVIDWNYDDGNNCIRLAGEDFYREVVRKGN